MLKHLILLAFTFVLYAYSALGQNSELWSNTYYGGNGMGVIVSTDGDGNNYQVEHEMGNAPRLGFDNTELLEVEPGIFYGTAYWGLWSSNGALFKYDANTQEIDLLYDFGINRINGMGVAGHLVKADNGKSEDFKAIVSTAPSILNGSTKDNIYVSKYSFLYVQTSLIVKIRT